MRASIGLGLIAVVSLVACTTTVYKRVPYNSDTTTTAADGTDPEAVSTELAKGIAITEVAVFQGVKVAIVKDGAPIEPSARKAPVIAGRPGLVRVYVTPSAGWRAQTVTAELSLVAGDKKVPVQKQARTISGASKDEDAKSVFDFELTAESVPAGVTFQVALTSEEGEVVKDGDESDARFPRAGGAADLGAQVTSKFKLLIVPIQYDGDESGRLPDVTAPQLERFRKTMMQKYPTTEVEVDVHEAFPWPTPIVANGEGWTDVLKAMHSLRQKEKAPKDVYYYGLFTPATSMPKYCPRGCVAGLSALAASDTAAYLRASVGLGYPGQDAANTMAHEIAHAHGREHAPCGQVDPDSVDADFPYDGGKIGSWGYDIINKSFIAPTTGTDIMGYCKNEWVSDYTYNALFERMTSVATAKDVRGSTSGHYRIATVDAAGDLAWGGDVDLDQQPVGGRLEATHYLSESGVEVASGKAHFYPFDHLPGGLLYVADDAPVRWKSLRVDGHAQKLVR